MKPKRNPQNKCETSKDDAVLPMFKRKPIERCPECGHRVHMPCIACSVRANVKAVPLEVESQVFDALEVELARERGSQGGQSFAAMIGADDRWELSDDEAAKLSPIEPEPKPIPPYKGPPRPKGKRLPNSKVVIRPLATPPGIAPENVKVTKQEGKTLTVSEWSLNQLLADLDAVRKKLHATVKRAKLDRGERVVMIDEKPKELLFQLRRFVKAASAEYRRVRPVEV